MASLVPFNIDLTAHEGTRLAPVLDALGAHWDPVQILANEAEAHCILYTHLDPDPGQQAAYDLLIDGVLPEAPEAINDARRQADPRRRAWLPCTYHLPALQHPSQRPRRRFTR